MNQYRVELSRILKSIIFYLTAAGIIIFAYTQEVFPPSSIISKPEPNGFYGTKPSNDPSLIMPEAAESLFRQYSENEYITYPFGYYKEIRLSQADRNKMAGILNELFINDISDILQENNGTVDIEKNGIEINGENLQLNGEDSVQIVLPGREVEKQSTELQLNPEITWERFKELMAKADNLIGGGSDFSETWISHRFGNIPVTYEEALADYELMVSYDKLTGAHARLFSDYMGIILGILPVFPAVYLCMCDRKKIAPMLYTRRISSVKFIMMRFFVLVTVTLIPILLMCIVLTWMHAADYGLSNIDIFAYFKYTFFWMLPTALAAISVGLFFTTLTNTPVAIAIQLLWWFTDDIIGQNGAYMYFGVRPFQLIPRHNDLGYVETYLNYLPKLIQNRIQMVLISVLFILGTIYVFSAKRRGLLYVPIFKHSKMQSTV